VRRFIPHPQVYGKFQEHVRELELEMSGEWWDVPLTSPGARDCRHNRCERLGEDESSRMEDDQMESSRYSMQGELDEGETDGQSQKCLTRAQPLSSLPPLHATVCCPWHAADGAPFDGLRRRIRSSLQPIAYLGMAGVRSPLESCLANLRVRYQRV
jgi:hypothetical protein